MNLETWQESVGKILLEFASAGRFVVQLNCHRWFQIIAISPPRSELVVMERAKLTENNATRSRMLDSVVHFLQHLNINIDDVDFVMDKAFHAKLSNVGTDKHPMYSTGSKHLKKVLLQCFENYDIIENATRMPKFISDGYKAIRDCCRVVTHEDFNKRCLNHSAHTNHLHSYCNLAAIGGDFSQIISEEDMIEFFPDTGRRAGMRVIYQNALNCIQLVESLDSGNKADFIRYSKAFLELVNPEHNQCQYMPSTAIKHVPDLQEAANTIKRLCELAESEDWFSLAFFNIALDYEISDIIFEVDFLTKGKMLPSTIMQSSYEPFTIDMPLKVRAVLDNVNKTTIRKAIKISDMVK